MSPRSRKRRTFDKMRDAVEAESGLKQVDWWIRSSAGNRIENPEYDPDA